MEVDRRTIDQGAVNDYRSKEIRQSDPNINQEVQGINKEGSSTENSVVPDHLPETQYQQENRAEGRMKETGNIEKVLVSCQNSIQDGGDQLLKEFVELSNKKAARRKRRPQKVVTQDAELSNAVLGKRCAGNMEEADCNKAKCIRGIDGATSMDQSNNIQLMAEVEGITQPRRQQ